MRTKHIHHFKVGGREPSAICTIFLLSAGHALQKKVALVSGPRVLLIDDGALLSADSALHHKSPGRAACIVLCVLFIMRPFPISASFFCSEASIHRFSFDRAQTKGRDHS
jgi:hypothetical protein